MSDVVVEMTKLVNEWSSKCRAANQTSDLRLRIRLIREALAMYPAIRALFAKLAENEAEFARPMYEQFLALEPDLRRALATHRSIDAFRARAKA